MTTKGGVVLVDRSWCAFFGISLAILSAAAATAQSGTTGTPQPGRMPLLMPDDFSELHLIAWRVEPASQDPHNPLIEGDTPWDSGGVGIHGSVFQDPLTVAGEPTLFAPLLKSRALTGPGHGAPRRGENAGFAPMRVKTEFTGHGRNLRWFRSM